MNGRPDYGDSRWGHQVGTPGEWEDQVTTASAWRERQSEGSGARTAGTCPLSPVHRPPRPPPSHSTYAGLSPVRNLPPAAASSVVRWVYFVFIGPSTMSCLAMRRAATSCQGGCNEGGGRLALIRAASSYQSGCNEGGAPRLDTGGFVLSRKEGAQMWERNARQGGEYHSALIRAYGRVAPSCQGGCGGIGLKVRKWTGLHSCLD